MGKLEWTYVGTDSIKAKSLLANMGFDGLNFYMPHRQRSLPSASNTGTDTSETVTVLAVSRCSATRSLRSASVSTDEREIKLVPAFSRLATGHRAKSSAKNQDVVPPTSDVSIPKSVFGELCCKTNVEVEAAAPLVQSSKLTSPQPSYKLHMSPRRPISFQLRQ